MADIIYRRDGGTAQLIVNGVDLSNEVYRDGVELVEVGDGEHAEVGFRITLAVSRLAVDTEQDMQITDRFPAVAQMVRSVARIVGNHDHIVSADARDHIVSDSEECWCNPTVEVVL